MQSFDGPVVTQFQMRWVALSAWLCNSLGPPPLWLKMISALRKNLPLSGGYQRWSFLKDMLLVWKVNVDELALRNATCFLPMSKRHIFIKLCWSQLQEQREKTSWLSCYEQQGWAYATDFLQALQASMLQTVFTKFEFVCFIWACAQKQPLHNNPPLS